MANNYNALSYRYLYLVGGKCWWGNVPGEIFKTHS